jgi:TPP-dependent pyruvate/acetoin dehydrogenase alpha subunit
MRSPTYGIIPDLIQSTSQDTSLELFSRMCISRYFELGLVRAVQDKYINYQIYLSLGQESVAAGVRRIKAVLG